MDFWGTVRRGLRLTGHPAGADTPGQFWPYAAAVLGGFMVVGNLVSAIVFVAMSGASADTRTAALVTTIGVAALVVVALLASAVVRRLHDRRRSVAWALVPLVSLVLAFALQARILLAWDEERGAGPFLIAFAAGLVYFATVIALVVQLALPRRATTG
jgi:uncharacterized membrane protein YhaH (DUF805 family)